STRPTSASSAGAARAGSLFGRDSPPAGKNAPPASPATTADVGACRSPSAPAPAPAATCFAFDSKLGPGPTGGRSASTVRAGARASAARGLSFATALSGAPAGGRQSDAVWPLDCAARGLPSIGQKPCDTGYSVPQTGHRFMSGPA